MYCMYNLNAGDSLVSYRRVLRLFPDDFPSHDLAPFASEVERIDALHPFDSFFKTVDYDQFRQGESFSDPSNRTSSGRLPRSQQRCL